MNRLPAFKNDYYYNVADVSGVVYNNCLSLPCSTSITDAEAEQVVNNIKKFYA
jgi:perosamine synthetase